jgi:antitoxin MazE
MRAKAQKWGNSLAVRIPKAIADQVGVVEEDELEIEAEAGVIRLRRARRDPSLEELLQGVSAENLHDETDFGRAEGRESW